MTQPLPLPSTVVSASRGARGASYHLLTPANRFPAKLPHLAATSVCKLVTPRVGSSRIGWYVLDFEQAGAGTEQPLEPGFEHFLYVRGGTVAVDGGEGEVALGAGGFAYVPDDRPLTIRATEAATALWVKRRWQPYPGVERPWFVSGHRDDHPAQPTSVPGFTRQLLLPAEPAFDFAMDLLAFEPGVVFRTLEIHDEEHGLYMTRGQGIYHLDGDAHEVLEDDFIYMAPYCPQYFYATGWDVSEYLLYKDVFRDGF